MRIIFLSIGFFYNKIIFNLQWWKAFFRLGISTVCIKVDKKCTGTGKVKELQATKRQIYNEQVVFTIKIRETT